MYDRKFDERTLNFEASGGLLNASLIMRDRETDSWWSIMTGDAIGGALDGTPLKELPAGEKARWKDWRKRYPDTRVLSVDGIEHVSEDHYARYFASEQGFRGMKSADTRLPDKASIYSFRLHGQAYAVPHDAIEGGRSFAVAADTELFFYREPGAELFASTIAYLAETESGESRFEKEGGIWVDRVTGAAVSRTELDADPSAGLELLGGFDTFWYIWAATHDNVSILR